MTKFKTFLATLALTAAVSFAANAAWVVKQGTDGSLSVVDATGAITAITMDSTGAQTYALGLTLDDGSGASPSLTFTDATNETAVLSKADSSFLGITTLAADGVNVLTGNLKVGNGTPGVTQNGEDFYVEGTLEADGAAQFDGAITANSTILGAGNVTLDDGVTDSPSLTFTDATDETAVFAKTDSAFLGLTTLAADGFNVLTGNLKIGNGTPGVAQDGEDAYIEGTFEVDGASQFDGAITANSTILGAGNVTLDDNTGDSPSLTFTDATNETAVLAKVDSDTLQVTTLAGDGFEIVTGNLVVGNGVPGVTLDGEDAYIEGTLEVDGVVQFDGATMTNNSDTTATSNLTFDDGTGASPVLTFTDGTDETAAFQKADSGFMDVTTEAADGFSITTGNLKVGNGTPGVAQDGEDAYIEGTLEVDGAVQFDAALVANGDITGDGGDQLSGFLHAQVATTTAGITAAQCGSTFVSDSTDVMTLPEASTVLGCRLTFVCGTADDLDINPADATDTIGTVASITGTNTTTVLAPSAGDAIRCTDIGSSIMLEAVGADLWASIGNANGIWTDVN